MWYMNSFETSLTNTGRDLCNYNLGTSSILDWFQICFIYGGWRNDGSFGNRYDLPEMLLKEKEER